MTNSPTYTNFCDIFLISYRYVLSGINPGINICCHPFLAHRLYRHSLHLPSSFHQHIPKDPQSSSSSAPLTARGSNTRSSRIPIHTLHSQNSITSKCLPKPVRSTHLAELSCTRKTPLYQISFAFFGLEIRMRGQPDEVDAKSLRATRCCW